MNSDDNDAGHPEVHRGYELEAGLIDRVREWTDVFPWIRLGRTLRIAASPPHVLLIAIVFSAWWLGQSWLGGEDRLGNPILQPGIAANTLAELPKEYTHLVASHFHRSTLTSLLDIGLRSNGWQALAEVCWFVLLWAPAAMLLARQGALLTAGRTMVGLKPGIADVIRRTPAAWLAAGVPLACVIAMGLLIVIVGWLARLCYDVIWVELFSAIVIAAVAIPCGVLAFGANVAVPLSWAALVNERDPDALDSLSRGYEYLLRRPLRLALYVTISLGILLVVGLLASGIAQAALSVATAMLAFSGSSPSVLLITQQILHGFPTVVVLTLAWSLLGGVYLLLRYDAGGQEVEDLWQASPPTAAALPDLPKS